MAELSDAPATQAHTLVERAFGLLLEARALLPQLEAGRQQPEPASAQAERLLYFGLVAALEAGLVRTLEDAVRVLRQASRPLGPMGAEWLQQQDRGLGSDGGGQL